MCTSSNVSRLFWNSKKAMTFQVWNQIRILEIQWDGRRWNSSRREPKASWDTKLKALTKILDHPSPEAVNALLTRGKSLLQGNDESMQKTWQVLKSYGFGIGALNEYPKLLLETPASAENYILIMKESGFHTIRPHMIIKFRDMSGKSIESLKGTRFISEKTDVVGNYFKILNMPTEVEKKAREALGNSRIESNSLVNIRMFLLIHYLSYRLEAPIPETRSLIMKNPRNKNRSFDWIMKTVNFLVDEIKFPKEKLRKHSYLIQCDPSRMRDIISKVPILGGRPILEMAHARPKILASSVQTLTEIDRLIQEAGISIAAVSKYPEIFTLSSSTIRERLQELDTVPQFTTFKSHPRVARVIYYQNKVRKRIKQLEAMDVHGVSLHILSTDNQRFDKFIQIGEMSNKGADIIHFVSSYLDGMDRAEVRQNLIVHPNWLNVPVVNVKISIQFLREIKGFSVNQIIKGLPLILYPLEKIENAMEKVQETGEAEIEDDFYLQMVLYFIESPVHFTGDGVWPKRLTHSDIDSGEEIDGQESQDAQETQLGELRLCKNVEEVLYSDISIDSVEEQENEAVDPADLLKLARL